MKIIIPLFFVLLFTAPEIETVDLNETDFDYINNIVLTETEICTEEGELCECIAAGGCVVSPGSSCRIIFCDGSVEQSSFNSKPDNITTIKYPCPKKINFLFQHENYFQNFNLNFAFYI